MEAEQQGHIRVLDMRRLTNVIFYGSLAMIVFLLACNYIFNYFDVFDDRSIRRIWNIAREQSLPSWFSSIQAQLLGVTVFFIAFFEAPSAPRWKTFAWVLIGLFFFWIGIDDYAEIHEKLGGALERIAEKGDNTALTEMLLQNPSYSWHTFIAPAFALFGLGILVFIWQAFWKLGLIHWIILGFGCWFVSQGIDFIEGLDEVDDFYTSVQNMLAIERRYLVTHTFKAVEESLEMLGTTLLWAGFLRYLTHVSDGEQFRLTAGRREP